MPVSGHLIGRDGAQNAALQEIISAALAGRMGELKVETAGGESTIRALPAKQVQAANVQLLKVILTIA
ncbi:MAG: hypothetical protein FJX29_02480 [Alphaproteobacteria bacterium]|nr:hypothetical protein [Alphaproteobacteria bacterium]